MGFKLRDGQKIHLPAVFKKKFTRLDYTPPGILRTPEDVLASIEKARYVFRRHSIDVRKGSSLDQLLSRSEREMRKSSGVPQRAADLEYVIAMAGILIGLADEDGIRILLDRIARGEMETSSGKYSQGKDALWELHCLSILNMGAMKSCLAEPDIVTDFGFGEYGIACKKVYSENSVEKCVKKGISQIDSAKMPGMVALNIDDLVIPPGRIMHAQDQDYLREMLQSYASEFVKRHRPTLEKYSSGGRCDGFLISASRSALLHGTGRFTYIGVNLLIPMSGPTDTAGIRMDSFARQTSNADGLEEWVAKVGGKAFGL